MASKSLGTLTLDLVARTAGFVKGMSEAERESDKWRRKVKRNLQDVNKTMGRVATVGIAGLIAGTVAVTRATIEQERVEAQLNATLRSTGRFTEASSNAMKDFASSLQGVTTFGDEAIIASESLLLTFTKIGGDIFPRAQKAILDVATAMGQDLQTASIQVGKALNDPVLGLTSLSRSGIQFSEAQKQVIKDLVETGDVAGAQAIILKELETQFGGSAEAARNTLGGALSSLKNAFGDLLEGDSGGDGVRGTTASINELTDTLSSSETKEAFARITQGLIELVGWTVETAKVMGFLIDEVKEFFGIIGENDIPRLEDEVIRLNKEIEFFGKNVGNNAVPKLESLREELVRVEGALEKARERAAKGISIATTVSVEDAVSSSLVDPLPEVQVIGVRLEGDDGVRSKAQSMLDAIADQIKQFEFQAETVGMTADAIKLLELANMGAEDSQIEAARAALGTVSAYEAQTEAAQRAAEEIERINADASAIAESLKSEEQLIRESYERRRQIVLDSTKFEGQARQNLLLQLEEETNEKLNELNAGFWEKYLASLEENLTSMDTITADMLENLTSGFGSAFEAMIFDAESLEDAVYKLAEGMLRSIVNALGQMAGQWLALQAVQLATGQSTQAATVAAAAASGPAIAAAYAPAASMVSLASFGANAVPAQAGIISTNALSKGLALAGMAHDGLDSVPQTGTWLLEKGERVTTADTSAKLDRTLSQVQSNMAPRESRGGDTRIINAWDMSMIGDYMGSSPGEKVIMNVVRKNQRTIKALAG